MMALLRSLWKNLYGLFVDDGAIAMGTLAAVALTGAWAGFTAAGSAARNLGGPLLFALLMMLLVFNAYGAGRAASRRHDQ
jgi:hypothetical protein